MRLAKFSTDNFATRFILPVQLARLVV